MVCGKTIRAADDAMAVTNPVVLIEVTSPSTEAYDQGAKLEFYKTLPSVREVLILSHHGPRATLHRRGQDGAWTVHEAVQGGVIEVQSVGASLAMDEVYRDFAAD